MSRVQVAKKPTLVSRIAWYTNDQRKVTSGFLGPFRCRIVVQSNSIWWEVDLRTPRGSLYLEDGMADAVPQAKRFCRRAILDWLADKILPHVESHHDVPRGGRCGG